jgi:hypothetical protein
MSQALIKLQRKGQFTVDRSTVEGRNRKAAFRELSQVVAELRQEAK